MALLIVAASPGTGAGKVASDDARNRHNILREEMLKSKQEVRMLKAKWQAASAESMFARMGRRMKILSFNLIASRNEHDRLVCRGYLILSSGVPLRHTLLYFLRSVHRYTTPQ